MIKKRIYNIIDTRHNESLLSWRWIADNLNGKQSTQLDWVFGNTSLKSPNPISKLLDPLRKFVNKRTGLGTWFGAFTLVLSAKLNQTSLVVTHGMLLAVRVAFFARLLRLKTPHLAFSFTMPWWDQYSPWYRSFIRWALRDIDQFVMYSSVETARYSRLLNIPLQRFQMIHWGGGTPCYDSVTEPMVAGKYIAAVGGEGRDYETLLKAAERLPEYPFIVVARPHNMKGLVVPKNVTVLQDISNADAMNIIANCQFMVLPLESNQVPTGHGTLISAFKFHKAAIVTSSKAMTDYVLPDQNALVCQPQDVDELIAAIECLWSKPLMTEKLADYGKKLALTKCTEEATANYFLNYLAARRIIV